MVGSGVTPTTTTQAEEGQAERIGHADHSGEGGVHEVSTDCDTTQHARAQKAQKKNKCSGQAERCGE
jgi:hypothetical protein